MTSKSTPMFDAIDYKQWLYTIPRRNPKGGFNNYVNANKTAKKSAVFQLPECEAKFGCNDAMGESKRRNLEVSVSDPATQDFFNGLDAQNLTMTEEQSTLLWKKELKGELLKMMMRPLLKYEKEYDPLLRLKCVPSGKDKTKVLIVSTDENGEEVYDEGNLDQITKNSKVVPIVSPGGMWYTATSFGMTMMCKAVMVWQAESEDEIQFNGLNVKKRKISHTASVTVEPVPAGGASNEVSPFDDEIM